MNHDQPVRGKLDLETLRDLIAGEEIETDSTALPDMYGRLLGKRIAGPFFMDKFFFESLAICPIF